MAKAMESKIAHDDPSVPRPEAIHRLRDLLVRISAGAASLIVCCIAVAERPPRMGVEQVIAHRGSSADRPENTLASFQRAIEAGATAVEVDVRTTSDGHLVILHDATLDRTTAGSGAVGDNSLAEVRQLDAGSWFDPAYAGQRVPTLKEVLVLCRGKVDVLLDLKEQGEEYARAIAGEVKAHGDPERTVVGVRSIEQAQQFRRLLPRSRQLGFIPKPEAIEAFAEAGVETTRPTNRPACCWNGSLEQVPITEDRPRKGSTCGDSGGTPPPDDPGEQRAAEASAKI
jgi:hypothetical protein